MTNYEERTINGKKWNLIAIHFDKKEADNLKKKLLKIIKIGKITVTKQGQAYLILGKGLKGIDTALYKTKRT